MREDTPSDRPPDNKAANAQRGPAPAMGVPGAPTTVWTRKAVPPPAPGLDLPIFHLLRSKRVILASASPRRKALMVQIGLTSVEILPSSVPEDVSKMDHTPDEYVRLTAQRKCLSVYEAAVTARANQDDGEEEPSCVIAADTIIATRDGRILEKPRSAADHTRMLRLLRDSVFHRVLTSVCVLAPRVDAQHPGYLMESHTEETRVFFAGEAQGLSDELIDAYVKTREGADKAGGYAIQGIGGSMLLDKVEGSVDNVVGLPVRKCLQLCERVIFRQDEDEGWGDGLEDDQDGA